MKRTRLISAFVCWVLLSALFFPSALADNVWDLPSGILLSTVRETERYDGYTALSYLKLRNGAVAVMADKEHALLLHAFKENGSTVLKEYHTVVRQPGETDWKRVSLCVDGDGFLLYYPGTCLHFEPCDTGFILGSVYLDTLTLLPFERNGQSGWYMCNDGTSAESWHPGENGTEHLTFDQINLRLFPRTLADVRAQQALSAAQTSVQLPFLIGEESAGLAGVKELAPVYSAPDQNAPRFGNGKASVDLGSAFRFYGFTPDGGWALISYEISVGSARFGYVKNDGQFANFSASSVLSFSSLTAAVSQDTFLTDDPDVSQTAQVSLQGGDSVTVLALYSIWYAYVETSVNGQTVRGFVPRAHLTVSSNI
jgi:hypothetical protein